MSDTINKTDLSRDMLIEILDQLPSPVYVKDDQTNFVAGNISHCRMIGKSNSELMGRNDFDFHAEDLARQFYAVDNEILKTGVSVVREETAVDAESGQTKVVLTRKARITGDDGRYYIIGTNSDQTEIRKRDDRFKTLAETVPVGVVQIEEGGSVLFSNVLWQQYFGAIENAKIAPDILQKLCERNAAFPGEACKFEITFMITGGEERHLIVISSGWVKIANSLRTATVSVIDVTEMMQLRSVNEEISRLNRDLAENVRKLNEAQDELVKRGRMEQLGQLTATVAHELRNPLGAVRTSAFLLERKLKDKGMNVETQLERINKGVVRCDNIITQLLDFSRNKALQTNLCDLDHWLAGVLEEECKKLPALVTISCNLALANTEVPIDGSRLERAIVNLVSNASEAMVGQGDDPSKFAVAAPAIHISTDIEGDFARIVVSDNGPGMPPDVLARIREPLFTTKSFGTGLGIPAIEQIANQHGGRLDITSEVGKGARFALYLPLVVKNIEPMVSAA